MRVIAGEKRGLRLLAPPGRQTRPTSDRVREAAFSMLESLGELEGATVWDLFAGSGAMGIEALSRGAARSTFVDQSAAAVSATRANLARVGYGPTRATVVRDDVLSWAGARAQAPPAGPRAASSAGRGRGDGRSPICMGRLDGATDQPRPAQAACPGGNGGGARPARRVGGSAIAALRRYRYYLGPRRDNEV